MRSIFPIALLLGLTLCGAADAQGVNRACHVRELCAGVQPGGGRIMDCLRAHKAELPETCLSAIGLAVLSRPVRAPQGSGPAAAGAPMGPNELDEQPGAPPAPGAPAAAPPGQSQPQ